MEVRTNKNNRFCCELVRSSSFATKSILIFILSLCICFITSTKVKASNESLSTTQAQYIINYFKNNIPQLSTTTTEVSDTCVYNILNNTTPEMIANAFNEKKSSILTTYTWDNVSIIGVKSYIYDATNSFTIFFTFSNKPNGNFGVLSLSEYNTYWQIKGSNTKYISITLKADDNNGTNTRVSFKNAGNLNDTSLEFRPKSNLEYNQNNTSIIFRNWINVNLEAVISYGTRYNIENTLVTFNNDGTIITPQEIENTEQSEYGYLWSPAYSGDTRVNLLYNGNSNIDCDYYIGNELTHTYNFYYMSGDSKISVNDYISIYTTQTTSGEWYKHYITNAGKEHLPNNTHFLLDVYANLGNQTATVVEDFNAFYTVEEVIPTPTPIPTATPTPTPTPDIGTISGQINDINNNISNSTQTIVEQISGDTEKIVNNLENISAAYSGEIQNDLPSSGEILEKTGYHERTNPYQSFWSAFISGLNENLLNDENVSIEFPDMTGTKRTINSSDFFVPDNPLKVYTNVAMTSLLVFQMLKFIREIINGLNQGEIHVLHDVDADVYFF